MKTRLSLLPLLALLCCIASGGVTKARGAPLAPGPPKGETDVLIDRVHANDFSELGLQKGVYEYHATCGFHRAFQYLVSRGVTCRNLDKGPLSAEDLSHCRVLFINLVSAEKEPFLVSEILAICSFVKGGGSLFVITDHSNCYFHAYRLKPLFTELGMKVSLTTACDVPPHTLGMNNAWITVTKFSPHPVTRGLRCLGIQTGGCVDSRFAVAWTSPQSWADQWRVGIYGEKYAPACYGDFRREKGEKSGPLGVVLARKLGKGRIVVVADQNIFADTFINYADNYRLWLNVMAWLLRDNTLRDPERYRQSHSPLLALFDQFDRAAFGTVDANGYYNAMCLLNRSYWTFANDRIPPRAALIVFAHNNYRLDATQLKQIVSRLAAGKNLLVLNADGGDPVQDSGVVRQVLGRLDHPRLTVRDQGDILAIRLPSMGNMYVLNDGGLFCNRSLAPPTVVPGPDAKARNARLLAIVRTALGPAATRTRGLSSRR